MQTVALVVVVILYGVSVWRGKRSARVQHGVLMSLRDDCLNAQKRFERIAGEVEVQMNEAARIRGHLDILVRSVVQDDENRCWYIPYDLLDRNDPDGEVRYEYLATQSEEVDSCEKDLACEHE